MSGIRYRDIMGRKYKNLPQFNSEGFASLRL